MISSVIPETSWEMEIENSFLYQAKVFVAGRVPGNERLA